MAKPKRSVADSVIKGNTGEYYTLAELSRRGWTAAQTARSTRVYDILARKGSCQVAIRVKTKTSDALCFQWNAKRNDAVFDEIGKNDFCVLVDIPKQHSESPCFYIIPTSDLNAWLQKDFNAWLKAPGKNGRQHSESNRRRMLYLDDGTTKLGHGYRRKLRNQLGKWELLEPDPAPTKDRGSRS